ncbi:MAG: helix-turn-helix domain-containing protein [Methanobrevibacter sp.]|nr:helix-turn-helix domain-containing protein [Candidatus Methanovirga aequatorialis]
MIKSRKLILYPNKAQEEFFELCFRYSRRTWNFFYFREQFLKKAIYLGRYIVPKGTLYNFRLGNELKDNKDDLDKKVDSRIKNMVEKNYKEAKKAAFKNKVHIKPK